VGKFVYDNSLVSLFLQIARLKEQIDCTDIDKFAYLYEKSEYGPDCKFSAIAYDRLIKSDCLPLLLERIKAIANGNRQ